MNEQPEAPIVMTDRELYELFKDVFSFIAGERVMRGRVFQDSHPDREAKLARCDRAMDALIKMKDFAKPHATPTPRQAVLFDEAERVTRRGGY